MMRKLFQLPSAKLALRLAAVTGAAFSVSGCYTGFGLGLYDDGGYYDCDPYSPFDNYYDCDQGYGFYNIGYGGGWYQDLFYPGYGFYTFDRLGKRFNMNDHHRHYWGRQRHDWQRNNYHGRRHGYNGGGRHDGGDRGHDGGRRDGHYGRSRDRQVTLPDAMGQSGRYGGRAEGDRGRYGRRGPDRNGSPVTTTQATPPVPAPDQQYGRRGRADGERGGWRRGNGEGGGRERGRSFEGSGGSQGPVSYQGGRSANVPQASAPQSAPAPRPAPQAPRATPRSFEDHSGRGAGHQENKREN